MNKTVILLLPLLLLTGCDRPQEKPPEKKVSRAELNEFIQQVKGNLVFVEGGVFEMGDFGIKLNGGQIDRYPDSKPLHTVELTGYSISKFKISNREYHFYLNYNQLPGRQVDKAFTKRWNDLNKTDDTPARIDWYESSAYCTWLGKITDLPFSLPTEAQWEYAARSRGEFHVLPTNTGKAEIEFHSGGKSTGINIATDYDREQYALKSRTRLGLITHLPGNAFPPNPLGIYDMAANGFEWVNDWYDPDYYKNSPRKDPQGPDKPVFEYDGKGYQKVARSSDSYNGITGSTVGRSFRPPKVKNSDYPLAMTARCVVNLSQPVNN